MRGLFQGSGVSLLCTHNVSSKTVNGTAVGSARKFWLILRCNQDGVCLSVAGTRKILVCDLAAFHDAVRSEAISVWLPKKSCDFLGVSYRDLPTRLRVL